MSLNIIYLSTSLVNQPFIHLYYSFFKTAYLYQWAIFVLCVVGEGVSVYFLYYFREFNYLLTYLEMIFSVNHLFSTSFMKFPSIYEAFKKTFYAIKPLKFALWLLILLKAFSHLHDKASLPHLFLNICIYIYFFTSDHLFICNFFGWVWCKGDGSNFIYSKGIATYFHIVY